MRFGDAADGAVMRLPKHSTVAAYLALFFAFGGTAYAATGGTLILGHTNQANATTTVQNTGSGPAVKFSTAKSSTAPFSVGNTTKVVNLNADQVDGMSASKFEPVANRIQASTTSAQSGEQPAGSAGPWTFTLTCGAGGPATLTTHGPGTIGGTTSLATGGNQAATYVGAPGAIGGGATAAIGQGGQMSQTVFLQSGTTIMKVQWLMTASNGGLFESCTVVGDATQVHA
jgi:hypothetical protein